MQTTYEASTVPVISGAHIGILQAKWYGEKTGTMVDRCAAILESAGSTTERHVVPGSLELPISAQILIAESGRRFDAVVCFGAIVQGDTYHFEMVADECTRGLGAVSRATGVPILSEVLAVRDLGQLDARTGDDDQNKGIEAALAAAELIAWRRALR